MLNIVLPRDAIGRNNAISVFLMGALPAIGGSVTSVMLYAFLVWGTISLLLGRFEFQMSKSDRILAWTFTSFVVLVVITALLGPNRADAPRATLWLLAYLSPWVIIPRLRASKGVDYLDLYIVGAACGVLAAVVFAFVQTNGLTIRAEGGAGNPAVFAIICLCLMGIGGLNAASQTPSRQFLAILAVAAGIVAIALSLTRGVGLVIFPILILLVVFAPKRWGAAIKHPATILMIVVAVLVLFSVRDTLLTRLSQTVLELQRVHSGQDSAAIGERLRLWHAAWIVIQDSPFWGHGIQNRMAVLDPILAKDGLPIHAFSHAHNAFLSFAIDGGVLVLVPLLAVLCVPVVIAWQAKRCSKYRTRLFLALIVVVAYAGCGLTQIMFKHDILDSFFVFFGIVVAASIANDKQEATANRAPPA